MMKLKCLSHLLLALTLAAGSAGVSAGAYDDLIAAVNRDDTETVLDFISRGMDVNTVDLTGNTLLHVAARNGNVKLLEGLLKNKANPNARNHVGDSPMMLAAFNGKLEGINVLLAAGAKINHAGWAPLHYAVFAEQAEMVEHLLSKGAKVDARAPNEQTALMLAAKNGNSVIARMLLKAKADANLLDQHGESALTLARKGNNTDLAKLLEQGAIASEPAAAKPAATKAVPPEAPAVPAAKPEESGEYVSPPFQSAPTSVQ